MTTFSRTDSSVLGRWWWAVDRWSLAAIVAIIVIGIILALAASPAVAEKLGLDTYYFARRHLLLVVPTLVILLVVSLMDARSVRRLALVGFVVAVGMMIATAAIGVEIKGARRWLQMGEFSVQPSELVKPCFAVVSAWIFAAWRFNERSHAYVIAVGAYLVVAGLLLVQPDVGMAILVSLVWGVQFFVAGLPMLLVAVVAIVFLVGGVAAYFTFPHVHARIDRFLDPSGGEAYQVARSLEAFVNGGVLGRGPGEGKIKSVLPDAHADFVFAVAGEEFGLIVSIAIVALFAFVVLRGFARALRKTDLFVLLAVTGLLVQFGLQAIINMATTLNLMPTKGMTLPFISYGGSSMVALAMAMGMVLALTREQVGEGQRE